MSMERKKIMTVVLLIAAVLVWGVIILKVVRGAESVELPVVESQPVKPVKKLQKDSLRLDYRDPFLGEFVRVKQEKKPVRPEVKSVRNEPVQPPVPDFTFKGMIVNDSGRKAMLMKNGSLLMLGPGGMIGDFKILEIFPECVLVQNGKYKLEVKVR